MAAAAGVSEDGPADRLCTICMEATSVWLVDPCTHFVACAACFEKIPLTTPLRKCPLCRVRVVHFVNSVTSESRLPRRAVGGDGKQGDDGDASESLGEEDSEEEEDGDEDEGEGDATPSDRRLVIAMERAQERANEEYVPPEQDDDDDDDDDDEDGLESEVDEDPDDLPGR